MNRTQKRIVILFLALLFILIASSKTEWRVCSACGVQDYNTTIAGTTIEFLSQREYDEFGTHKKWQEKFGAKHEPHEWILLEEKTKDIIKVIDSL